MERQPDRQDGLTVSPLRKYFIVFFILLLAAAVTVNFISNRHKNNEIVLSQSANSSSGVYWEYKLSTDGIIEEKQYYESRFPLNFGPGYEQNWIFEVIGEGEVTIHWTAYHGSSIDYKKSYDITYYFKDSGSYTVTSSQSEKR